MNPPDTIELQRIRLRRPALSDAEAIFEYGADPEVARYADWQIRTSVDQVIESLRTRRALWESGAEKLASGPVLEKEELSRHGVLRRWVVRPNISSQPRDAFMYSCGKPVNTALVEDINDNITSGALNRPT